MDHQIAVERHDAFVLFFATKRVQEHAMAVCARFSRAWGKVAAAFVLIVGLAVTATPLAALDCTFKKAVTPIVDPVAILDCLRAGVPVTLDAVEVRGILDLTSLPTGTQPSDRQAIVNRLRGETPFNTAAAQRLPVRWIEPDLTVEPGTVLGGFRTAPANASGGLTVFAGRLRFQGNAGAPILISNSFEIGDTAFLDTVTLSHLRLDAALRAPRSLFDAAVTMEHIAVAKPADGFGLELQESRLRRELRLACLRRTTTTAIGPPAALSLNLDRLVLGGAGRIECLDQPHAAPLAITMDGAELRGAAFTVEKVALTRFNADRLSGPASVVLSDARVADTLRIGQALLPGGLAIISGSRVACLDLLQSRLGSLAVDDVTAAVDVASPERGLFRLYGVRIDGDLTFYRFHGGSVYLRAARIGGNTSFHGSRFDTLDLGYARFGGPATFGTALVGQSTTQQDVTLSLEGASFAGTANLDGLRLSGAINLSFTSFEAGKLLARWQVIGTRATSLITIPTSPSGCRALRAIAPRPATPLGQEAELPERLGSLHARLEANFRSLDRADDSAEAIYLARANDETESASSRFVLGWLWGHGVRPMLPLLWLGCLGLLTWLGLLALRPTTGPLVDQPQRPSWARLPDLPIRQPFGLFEPAPPTRPAPFETVLIALAILLPLKLHETQLVVGRGFSVAFAAMLLLRVMGLLLVALAAIALARTVPMLREILDTATRFGGA